MFGHSLWWSFWSVTGSKANTPLPIKHSPFTFTPYVEKVKSFRSPTVVLPKEPLFRIYITLNLRLSYLSFTIKNYSNVKSAKKRVLKIARQLL
jgi:hypothetical protein